MIRVIDHWLAARTARERRLLAAMAAILLPLLMYALIVSPMSNAYRDSLQEHLVAVDRNARVKALAEAAGDARPAVAPNAPDLALYLIDNARQRGIEANGEGNSTRARISVQRVAPSAILSWLNGLENAGYAVESLRIASVGDGSVSAELVAARTVR